MRLTLRHISGSRAGQEQTFDGNSEITIGRHPSSTVLFDPEKERVVSGRHASLSFDGNSWMLRDLGSSNGTFINGEQVTERALRPGEVVQLGKNGPKIQLQFDAPDAVEPTYVVPLDELKGEAPREGKTLIMMMPPAGEAAAASGAAAYVAPAPKKKGGIGRALLIVGAALAALLIVVVGLALMMRSSNMKKRRAIAAKKPAVTQPAAAAAAAEANKLSAAIAAKQQAIAQTQAAIQQQPTNAETEDLKRQLAESQALLEQMTRQLQQKNDEVAAAQSRPPVVQREVRYIPAPKPKSTGSTPASQPTTTPTQIASKSATTPTSSSRTSAVSEPAPSVPQTQLYTGKRLKARVLITPLPPEIPPAGLPSGTARDLAALLGQALVSTGDFVMGPKGQASVSVMVTNFRNDVRKNVDTKKTADSARKLGRLLGQKVPANPVEVKSVAYDAAMSVRVRLYDPSGRVLAEVEPSAESADRKTKTAVAGVSFNEIALSDTATGDVARKVIGDAIDTVRSGMGSLDWSTIVIGQKKEVLTLGTGRSANVEPGDVFEVVDGGRAVGRARVTSVTETGAEAEYIGTMPAKLKLNGKTARYVGSENPVPPQGGPKSLVVRVKTPAFSGPGNSFNEIKELKTGARLQFQYSVGPWAKVSDGGSSFWVPLAKVQIGS